MKSIRIVATMLFTVAMVGVSLVAASESAEAATQATFVVSPTGSGTTCSFDLPCSLATAQGDVHSLSGSMTGDLVVSLLGGTYNLTSAFALTSADSGTSGHTVRYSNYAGQIPVFSGGQQIAGWSLYNSSLNIYSASAPSGLQTRELWVNGVRATRASVRADVMGTVTQTSTGYTVSNSSVVDSWANPSAIEMVYTNQGSAWTESRCPVSSISGGTVTMAQPCFNTVTTDSQASHVSGAPTSVENALAFVTQPGQWYLDNSSSTLYYIPRPGESMSNATVVAPTTQSLLSATGTTSNPIRNIQISGITFEYTSWTLPSTSKGFVEFQANVVSLATTSGSTASESVPGAVSFSDVQNIAFSGNTLTHLGSAGLQFHSGSSGNSIVGNVVSDTSGNGIDIGDGNYPTGDPGLPTLESGDTVQDNYVHDIAVEYHGGVGIFAGYVANTTIDHNDVADSPYTGISLGWGWGVNRPSNMGSNHIDYNLVSSPMTTSVHDGGAIYVNGPQDANSSPTSTIHENYVTDISTAFGALYLDGSTTNWNVTQNVVGTANGTNWLNFGAPTPLGNDVESNYSLTANQSGTPSPACPATSTTNCVQSNSVGLSSFPSAALSIISAAGLESGYLPIAGGAAISNLVAGATLTSSSSYNSSFSPAQAHDSNAGTGFSSATGDTAAWLEADLGQQFGLSSIQILTRQDLDQPISLQGFTAEVSNSATGPWTSECSQAAVALPYKGSWNCIVTAGTWRYVRIAKTDTAPLFISELRVYGSTGVDSNIALNKTAYAQTALSGYPASQADDGNIMTGWSGADDNAAYWEVDLGAQYTIEQVQMVFRQDSYDQPNTREDLAVWVSNNLNMSLGYTQICSTGNTPLAYKDTLSCLGNTGGTFRYVAVVRTANLYCFLAEVRVLGH
jgi:hypothetical protein